MFLGSNGGAGCLYSVIYLYKALHKVKLEERGQFPAMKINNKKQKRKDQETERREIKM